MTACATFWTPASVAAASQGNSVGIPPNLNLLPPEGEGTYAKPSFLIALLLTRLSGAGRNPGGAHYGIGAGIGNGADTPRGRAPTRGAPTGTGTEWGNATYGRRVCRRGNPRGCPGSVPNSMYLPWIGVCGWPRLPPERRFGFPRKRLPSTEELPFR